MPERVDYLLEDVPPALVKVGDESYRLADRDEYSLMENRDFHRKWTRIAELEAADETSAAEADEYEALITELAQRALPEVDASEVASWRRSWRTAIIAAFLAEAQKRGAVKTAPATSPPGPESSAPSSGSTAEGSTTG